MQMLAEDIEAGGGELQHPPDRSEPLQGRRQHREHAGQGRLPQRSDGAHPVRADDRDGAEAAAADRAALDQQVLRARPQPGEELHPLGGVAGPDGVLHLVGQSGRAARREELRALHARGHLRGPRRDRGGDRREEGHGHRLLRRRHAARGRPRLHGGQEATSGSTAPPSSPTQVDFTHAGDLKVFVDEEQIQARRER